MALPGDVSVVAHIGVRLNDSEIFNEIGSLEARVAYSEPANSDDPAGSKLAHGVSQVDILRLVAAALTSLLSDWPEGQREEVLGIFVDDVRGGLDEFA